MTVKLKLDFEYDYDFTLIGISCHEKEHRLCWAINKALSFNLKKTEDLEVKEKKQDDPHGFSLFEYEEEFTQYYLLCNRNASGVLIPEQKQADYLLLVKGTLPLDQKNEIVTALRNTDMILTVFDIHVDQLKSKQKLMF